MKLHAYWKVLTPEQKKKLAKSTGTSFAYLSQIANGHRGAGETIALAIERATCGQVTVAELRPQFADDLRRSGYVRQPLPMEQPSP
jgi:DNA-binding transcriptional regulator YdaS (Cro superfamily)